MITDERLREIETDPGAASLQEIADLCAEVRRWRPVNEFVHETLKAIYLNAKEEEQRTLVLDVITAAARTCMKRMKEARYGG